MLADRNVLVENLIVENVLVENVLVQQLYAFRSAAPFTRPSTLPTDDRRVPRFQPKTTAGIQPILLGSCAPSKALIQCSRYRQSYSGKSVGPAKFY